MKANVYDLDGKVKKTIELPAVFETAYRPDAIHRASVAAQSARKQPQGRDPMAGKRNTAVSWGPGRGMARVPRVKGSGTRTANSGAFAPMTVGGRLAHPPRPAKVLVKKVNKKERQLAIDSALAATSNAKLVAERGHLIEDLETPVLVFDDKIQTVKRTKTILDLFTLIGLGNELGRAAVKRIKAGKGKRRGRRYKRAKGPLIVAENFGILQAAKNIPGIETRQVTNLSIEDLAPGGHAGRLVIWSESSINALNQRS